MANAKKLTKPQIAALLDAAKGECVFRPYAPSAGYNRSTINALRARGLLGYYRSASGYELLPAGRQALFETTGSWGAQETPKVEPPPKEEP